MNQANTNVEKDIKWLVNRRMGIMLLLGFSSGLPLALSSGTLQAWLATTSIDIRTIGIFSLTGLPYTIKFFWSPMMDRFVPPIMGRRRGWILLTQFLLIGFITTLAFSSPVDHLAFIGILAICIAFCSASQDISIDAYRADLLHPKERGLGAALSVTGYRIAMWVSSGLALIIADHSSWQVAYCVMAGLLFIGVIATLFSPEPTWQPKPPVSLKEAVIEPFKEFIIRSHAIIILIFIVMYKLGDAFAGSLTMTFLLRGLDFTLTEVGLIYKLLVIFTTIIGGLLSGALIVRYGLYRCLLWFGILQAVTNFGFMVLAWIGKSYLGMIIVIALENFAGGMGTIAFVALLMALCNHQYTATQFALLSALAAIGRVFVGPPSGYLVDEIGWILFFFITFLVALPGLFLLLKMKTTIEAYDKTTLD